MLHYVHIVHYSPKDASLVTLELESQIVRLGAVIKVVAVGIHKGAIDLT